MTDNNGLDQSEIMALLVEAVNCDQRRLPQISIALKAAICQLNENDPFEEGRQDAMETVINGLFYQAYKVNPALLPGLFPVFAMLCGKRPERLIYADIDWTLIK